MNNEKKISLKRYLINEIMKEGYLPLSKVHAIAESLGHKQRTAERRLNQSESPLIETCYDEKRQVIGYKWKTFNKEVPQTESDRLVQASVL